MSLHSTGPDNRALAGIACRFAIRDYARQPNIFNPLEGHANLATRAGGDGATLPD